MKIKLEHISEIETALGIKLYDHQKAYLLGKSNALLLDRKTGKTVAYCIKLALSEGPPLNIDRPEDFSDRQGMPNNRTYAKLYFRDIFMEIRSKLEKQGLPVRGIEGFKSHKHID